MTILRAVPRAAGWSGHQSSSGTGYTAPSTIPAAVLPATIQCLLQVMTGGWPGAATDLVPRAACAMSSGGRTWMLGGARRGPCRSPARASGPGWADRVARLAGRRHSLLHATAMRTVSLWSSWCHSPNWCAPFVSWPCSDCVD
jgi:hypothetical protein